MSTNSTRLEPSNGISGGYQGSNQKILRAMTAFSAIAWYNAIEILILIFIVFKKYSGLYFWSIFATAASIVPYQTGVFIKQMNIMPQHLTMISIMMSTLGWLVMVPGQSLVLYSRLHLVTQNEKLLRFIFRMIVINAVVLCIPTAVLTFGSNSHAKEKYLGAYGVYEKVQMTLFTFQEFFISCVYLGEIRRILKIVMEGGTRKILLQVAIINLLIMVMDITLLGVEFANYYQIETTLKGMIYAIKLKLEFGVLGNLVVVVTDKRERHHRLGSKLDHNPKKLDFDSDDIESLQTSRSRKASLQKSGISSELQDDNNIMYPDWRVESEPSAAPVQPHLLDEIMQYREAMAPRRCSIDELYPGRLCPTRREKRDTTVEIIKTSKSDDPSK